MLSISNLPKKPPAPQAFFVSAKNALLGRRYELSVAFVGAKEIRRLNRVYRGKDSPTDILSFPLSEREGEIIFCMSEVRREAPRFGRPPANFLKYLLIHGLLHLKGYRHGRRMERQERIFRKKFKV